jgi:Kyakuja-Dileera-Zisupton transposase
MVCIVPMVVPLNGAVPGLGVPSTNAHNTFQKAPCENQFRAIELSMLGSKACDVTGVVAIACARHGCFAPNSIADLHRGEGQKNVDWAFLQALKRTNMDPEQSVMLIYDIACQYFVHLQDRIGHLLPAGLTLDRAIGMFHVHGHKEECFFRYATSFIPGTGVTIGEILEMLWSSLNSITPTVRTASLGNRAETIDDHATDSNHKKMLSVGECSFGA